MTALAPLASAETSRAVRPGLSGVRRAIVVGIFVLLFAALGYGIYGFTQGARPNVSDPQSWLPKQQLKHPIDLLLSGTVGAPALTVAGNYVRVHSPGFTALAVMTGPVVPGEGLPNQMRFTTCTWTISISHIDGKMPLSLADFDTIDHTGQVFKTYLIPGEAQLPAFMLSGQHITFKLRAEMPIGEGLLRWAPDGNDIVAKWDYQVEND